MRRARCSGLCMQIILTGVRDVSAAEALGLQTPAASHVASIVDQGTDVAAPPGAVSRRREFVVRGELGGALELQGVVGVAPGGRADDGVLPMRVGGGSVSGGEGVEGAALSFNRQRGCCTSADMTPEKLQDLRNKAMQAPTLTATVP